MDKRYFTEYYTYERAHWWFTVRARLLADRVRSGLKPSRRLRILNVGVATGATSSMLSEFGDVTSLEFDGDCCKFLREELKMEVTQGSILELPFGASTFDLVCAFDVIEHVEDDALAVREMHRVCGPEGHILVTVPAFMSLWSKHDEVNHHFRRYKLGEVRNLFHGKVAGRERFASYFNSLLFPPIWLFRRVVARLLPKGERADTGSDFGVFSNGLANKVLGAIFSCEIPLLRMIRFPLGVSIIYHWQKSDSQD